MKEIPKCPICGYNISGNDHDICSQCGWEQDLGYFNGVPLTGANDLSLYAYQMRYRLFLDRNKNYRWASDLKMNLFEDDVWLQKDEPNRMSETFDNGAICISLTKNDDNCSSFEASVLDVISLNLSIPNKIADDIYHNIKDELLVLYACEPNSKLQKVFAKEIIERYKKYEK